MIKLEYLFLFSLLLLNPLFAKESKQYRYNQDNITNRKSLIDAYDRFGKIYKPYSASQSNLDSKLAQSLEKLFTLSDMAVIEKVLLLEFIGEVADGEVTREKVHIDYYSQILDQMKSLELTDKRLVKIRDDLVKGINFHREVLYAWLDAARKNQVNKVKNANGVWVHPGTSKGDQIFSSLYYQYIQKEFSSEYPENLAALARHICVLVF
jgi:hypothetical protein